MSDEYKPCTTCNGSGSVDEVIYIAEEMHVVTRPCGSCGGTGRG